MKLPLLLLTLVVSPFAAAFGFDDIANWTGSGPNRAALVIDFKNGGPAYAWGYRYAGTKSGFDMLDAVAASDPSLETTYTVYSFGTALTAVRYGSLGEAGFDPGSPGYWSYYVADATSSLPTTWAESGVGMSDRALATDSWDGWSWAANFDASAPGASVVAAAPVPEPASLIVLGIGVLALKRRRRASY